MIDNERDDTFPMKHSRFPTGGSAVDGLPAEVSDSLSINLLKSNKSSKIEF